MKMEFFNVRNTGYPEAYSSDPFSSFLSEKPKKNSDKFAIHVSGVAVKNIAGSQLRGMARLLVANELVSDESVENKKMIAPLKNRQEAWLQHVQGDVVSSYNSKLARRRRTPNKKPRRVFGKAQVLDQHSSVHSVATFQASSTTRSDIHVDGGAFHASQPLISAWIDGLNLVRAEAKIELLPAVSANTLSQYAYELNRQLRKVISSFAKRKSYEFRVYRITLDRNFLPSIEGLLCDHLMLPPRSAVAFLDIFKEELYSQTKEKNVFQGHWGRLEIDSYNELVLRLEKRRARNLSSVLKGK